MHFICSKQSIRHKYQGAATKILQSVERLGHVTDVSNQTQEQIQGTIAALANNEAVCLVGGYDLIPPFMRPNPTAHLSGDDDQYIATDSPYGAKPGKDAEEFAPSRAICRIPDGATANAASFLSILSYQREAPRTPTPPGSFEEAAKEFSGALAYVHEAIPETVSTLRLSPPDTQRMPELTTAISKRGRVHILLHGANADPDWAYLWGHDGKRNSRYIKALSARLLDLCDMRGAIVTFSSCYATMLDVAPATAGARTADNQVALACLVHGAKVVFGATRSNWIGIDAPYDAYGPRLMAEVWRELATGQPAAEALRRAKHKYLKTALSARSDQPFALKTVLQAQCYGHPGAKL